MTPAIRRRLLAAYCIILTVASLYCLAMAGHRYTIYHSRYVFFYHQLVISLSQHGVYFSIFVFVALVYLLTALRKREFIGNKSVHIALILFLSFFLLLLSSKMVIVFYAVFLIYYLLSLFKRYKRHRSWILPSIIIFIVTGCMILLTTNPVSQRFNDIFHGDIRYILKDKFDRADYFNGVQFRLLQWRLVPEILTENKSWVPGVGTGDAQNLLDQQYISKNMYQGDPAKKGSRGYLDYNTHNQFLQSLLQTGIIGAAIFLLITCCLARMAWKSRDSMYVFIVALLIVYSLIESVFETQYGILLYTFFPLFMRIESDSSYTHSRLPKR
jgi:O-antigen ligase